MASPRGATPEKPRKGRLLKVGNSNSSEDLDWFSDTVLKHSPIVAKTEIESESDSNAMKKPAACKKPAAVVADEEKSNAEIDEEPLVSADDENDDGEDAEAEEAEAEEADTAEEEGKRTG